MPDPVTSIQGNQSWSNGDPNTPTILLYSFDDSDITWDSPRKAQFRTALEAFEAVANIRFFEVADQTPDINLTLSNSVTLGANVMGQMGWPQPGGTTQGSFNADHWGPQAAAPGGAFFSAMLQEIGHALGLAHPHDTGLGTTIMQGVINPTGDVGAAELNQSVHTVMSLNTGWYSENGTLPDTASFGGNTGLGSLDIAALQALYGAQTGGVMAGDTLFELPLTDVPGGGYRSIWDVGGVDMIRYSGTASATLDLRAATLSGVTGGDDGGPVSHVAGILAGFTIARGTVIENAASGSGDDTILGNNSANTLWGNEGNDTLYGAGGADVLSGGADADLLYGGAGADVLRGEDGSDRLYGDDGADTVFGGNGADTLYGGDADDVLSGGVGTDWLYGGDGTDQFLFGAGQFNDDRIYGGSGTDWLVLSGQSSDQVYVITTTLGQELLITGDLGGSLRVDGIEQVQYADGTFEGLSDFVASRTLTEIETAGDVPLYSTSGHYAFFYDDIYHTLREAPDASAGPGSYPGLQAIQLEALDPNTLLVLWRYDDGRYRIWETDGDGVFQTGYLIDNEIDYEVSFSTDLNADGVIGHVETEIETAGDVTLIGSTQRTYTLRSSAGDIPLTGPSGEVAGPGVYDGWTALHAEEDGAGGYWVLWRRDNGEETVWHTNSAGQFVGSEPVNNLIDLEVLFETDLNNDGAIGHATSELETTGDVTLLVSTQPAYLLRSGGNDIVLRGPGGEVAGPGVYTGWAAIQAEEDGAGGYWVLWEYAGGANHVLWRVDGSGQRTGGEWVSNLIDHEVLFETDLNNDGAIGHATSELETTGDVTLLVSTQPAYLLRSGGNDIVLRGPGGEVAGPGVYTGWAAIQAEEDGAGGYWVLWEYAGGANHVLWRVDGSGQRTGGEWVSNLIDHEVLFETDLNQDGIVGHVISQVEDAGDVTLRSSSKPAYLIVSEGVEITLRGPGGEIASPESYAGWAAIQAEENGAGGFHVLWENTNGSYLVWNVDASGAFVSNRLVTDIVTEEPLFEADLTSDGDIGYVETVLEAQGDESLVRSETLHYIIRTSGGDIPLLGPSGAPVGVASFAGWSALQVEAVNSGGFRVLWENVSGQHNVWRVNEDGRFDLGFQIGNLVDYEELFAADLNNDAYIGHINTTLESAGAIDLVSSTRGYYILRTGPGDLKLKFLDGSLVGADTFAGWSALQVEADDNGGYKLFWRNDSGLETVWTVDANAQFVTSTLVANPVDQEAFFGADLNSDGVVGHTETLIEDAGDVSLLSSTQGYYLLRGSSGDLILRGPSGDPAGPDSFSGWQGLHVEEEAGGYRMLWRHDSGAHVVWTISASGQFLSSIQVGDLVAYETLFETDLDGDGNIGGGADLAFPDLLAAPDAIPDEIIDPGHENDFLF